LIPCLFLSLILSLTLGDLSLITMRRDL
jgi:hypothetical protein